MALDLPRVAQYLALFQVLFWAAHVVSTKSRRLSRKYLSLDSYDRNQWCGFVCSFVKGVAICSLCYPIAFRNAWIFWEADSLDGAVNGTDMELPLYLFLGYALSDTVTILSYFRPDKGDTAMLIHHIATLCIWSHLLHLDFAYTFACIACLVECTTPLLAARWFMASTSLRTHSIYILNGLMILVGWWLLRILVFVGFFGWKLHVIFEGSLRGVSPRDWPVIAMYLIGALLQILWCHKLTAGFIKIVRTSMKKE